MSSQAQRRPRQDAAKKRREYLLAKARARTVSTIAGLITLAILALAVVLFGLAFRSSDVWATVMFSLNVAEAAAIPGVFWHKSKKEFAAIPYVPPVAEQLAALPANQILLRGSDQPANGTGELMRATQEGTETAPEELVRAAVEG